MNRTLKILFALGAVSLATLASAKTFQEVALEAKQERAAAQKELDAFRKQVADKKLPISRQIKSLEEEYLLLSSENAAKQTAAADKTAALRDLKDRVEDLNQESDSLKNRLGAYINTFSEKLSEPEFELYKEEIDELNRVSSDSESLASDVIALQLELMKTSIGRIKNIIGGARLKGSVSIGQNEQASGQYVLAGPFSYFSNDTIAGFPLNDPNKAYPFIYNKGVTEETIAEIRQLTQTGKGNIPLDATGSDAIKMLNAHDGFIEHIVKGGITMVPLLGMFVVAICIAIFKFFEIMSVKTPKKDTVSTMLKALKSGDKSAALEAANSVSGPFGDLLVSGVEHADEEKEVLEEVLYERLLAAQPKLERFVTIIALTAASAPLLGLLGTVTGMIQTFKAINTYGTGDPATLSDGISVALITTEYGLIVAVPCLVVQVLLTRIAKGKLARMERESVAFVNGLHL